MKKRKKAKYWVQAGVFLAIGIASWSFYNILNQAVADLLSLFGISNFYIQNGLVVAFIFLFLILGGTSLKKAFEKIAK